MCGDSRINPSSESAQRSACKGVTARRARAGGWGDNSVLGTLSRQVGGSTAESTHIMIILRRAYILHLILNNSSVSLLQKVQQSRTRMSGRLGESISRSVTFAHVSYFDVGTSSYIEGKRKRRQLMSLPRNGQADLRVRGMYVGMQY